MRNEDEPEYLMEWKRTSPQLVSNIIVSAGICAVLLGAVVLTDAIAVPTYMAPDMTVTSSIDPRRADICVASIAL